MQPYRGFKSAIWAAVWAAVMLICATRILVADEGPGQRWALILVALPGDEPHAEQFRTTATIWQRWFLERGGLPADQILIRTIQQPGTAETLPDLTADEVTHVCRELASRVKTEDQLWVLTLGHGSVQGRRATLHVAGPDLADDQFAQALDLIACRQQIIWLTHTASSPWLPRLTRPDRIVVVATSDGEDNETEFPHALATVLQRTLPSSHEVDKVKDEAESSPETSVPTSALPLLTVADLFEATRLEVTARFANDKRVATEHAQLDDNGDGRGTEQIFVEQASDGERARTIRLFPDSTPLDDPTPLKEPNR